MLPMFDKDCLLKAWFDPGQHLFDHACEWIAFENGEHFWSARTGNWLGPVRGLCALDTSGLPVLWSPAGSVIATGRPATPGRAGRPGRPGRPGTPGTPGRPARPASPGGGWSRLSFEQWITG